MIFSCVLVFLSFAVLFAIDYYLPYEDELRKADAIFVLNGEYPFRIWAALDLYHEAYAPLVYFSRFEDLQGMQKLAKEKRGYGSVRYEQVYSLQKSIPVNAIRISLGEYKNTAQELALILDHARAQRMQSIILVTSDYHARRVRMLADETSDRSIAVIVRMTPYQAMMQELRWTRHLGMLRVVVSEFIKVLYFYLPDRLQNAIRPAPDTASGLKWGLT